MNTNLMDAQDKSNYSHYEKENEHLVLYYFIRGAWQLNGSLPTLSASPASMWYTIYFLYSQYKTILLGP